MIETTSWLEIPQPKLKLEIWTLPEEYYRNLGIGYLREIEQEFGIDIADGLRDLVVMFMMIKTSEPLDWNDDLLFKMLK